MRFEDFTGASKMPSEDAWLRLSSDLREADICEAVRTIASLLGRLVPGRSGKAFEIVKPTASEAAHGRSLSRTHGKAALPLHVETSHRPSPCRYVVLGCVDPGGAPNATTTLLNRQDLRFSNVESAELMGAPMLVRSGRRSFYSTILPRDGAYLRFDRGCMEAVCARGRRALEIVESHLGRLKPQEHGWRSGDIIIIDNWRALHGRGDTTASGSRRLVRAMADA